MFPTLFSIGSFDFRTMTVFVLLSFFLSSFIFWRKGREEHYSEGEIFDGFVLSILIGGVVARTVFILFNIDTIGWNIINWLDVIQNPGLNLIAGIAAATGYMYRYTLQQKWDAFEVLDFWVTSIAIGLSVYSVGSFFDGVGYGYGTNLPWGVVFPQLVEPHHPVQLYFALFYFLVYVYLSRVEYSYRTFEWYRHGKKTAQTGFLTAAFLILVSVFNLCMLAIRPATLVFYSINVDVILSISLALFGVLLLYSRSGRSLPFTGSKKTRPVRTKLENLPESDLS